MDQRRLVGTRRIGIATWRPIDKCAAQLAEAFFGMGTLPCKNITANHFQAASRRTCAALSSKFLIPLLTMWTAAFGGNPLGRPHGPRGRCGQPLRGPFRTIRPNIPGCLNVWTSGAGPQFESGFQAIQKTFGSHLPGIRRGPRFEHSPKFESLCVMLQ